MRHLPTLMLIAITFLLTAVFSEVVLRLLAPVADPLALFKHYPQPVNQFIRSEFPPHLAMITEVEPGLPGIEGRNRFTTNNMGYRGDSLITPKPQSEFRIFLIGGSSTECLYLDDSKSLDRQLQFRLQALAPDSLQIKVYNAGKSGDASDDHIAMLVHRIVHLEPNIVVVFAGINDLIRHINDYDYLHFVERREPQRISLFKLMLTELQLGRRVYMLYRSIAANPLQVQQEITLKSDYRRKIQICQSAPVANMLPEINAVAYARNLANIAGIAEVQNFELIFMTQQTTWNSTVDSTAHRWHWMRWHRGITYAESTLDIEMERFNDVMRTQAVDAGVKLFDLSQFLPKSTAYFYDDVHFNVYGVAKVAEAMASFIDDLELLAIPF